MTERFTTTNSGAPVASDAHAQTVGADGPIVLHDHYLVEKLAQFNRERVPERVVHAKGGGAFGTFTVTNDVSAYTRAALFQPGTTTEMLARFSTVAGENGSPDTWRDPRGFALKFYTEDGNWDMVGNNTPVFFIRDPRKFPDLNKAVKRDPRTNMRSATNNWDWWTLLPEALHQVTIVMSDRGIPQIPVNAARCPVHSNHRDGYGRVDGNYGSLPHYEPNSFHQWQEQPQYREPPLKIKGDADWWNYRDDDADYYKQPGDLFRLMTPEQRQALFDNTARAMGDAPDFIKQRHVDTCRKADRAYGAGVEAALRKLGAFASTNRRSEE